MSSPIVMGILNVTPDSFYKASRVFSLPSILEKASQLIEEGAHILDIGGFSSRPGAADVSIKEEIRRVIEPISAIKKSFPDIPISLDTFRSEVAQAGLDVGADIINDISGGQGDKHMYKIVGKAKAAYILMHMRGYATDMMANTVYDNMLSEITSYFQNRIEALTAAGVNEIIIDPGFGFSKTLDQNYELLNNLQYFNMIAAPVLVGLSRKSMVYKFLNTEPENALIGTNVLNFAALQKGARILRVHDVKEATETIKLYNKLTN